MTEKEHLYIPELTKNIADQDVIKGLVILENFADMGLDTKRDLIQLLSQCDESYFLLLISEFLTIQPNVLHTFPDLRELILHKLKEKPVIANWLPPQISNELLIEVLNMTENESDMVELIITLGDIAVAGSINHLSDLLYSGSWNVTKAAIQSLGRIGNEQAVNHLVKRLGSDEECDLQILEALAKTGTAKGYKILCDHMGSRQASSRNIAKTLLLNSGASALPFLYENLAGNDSDSLIHTFNVLGVIGDSSAAKPIRQFLFHAPKDANVRFAAFEALSNFKLAGGSFILATGLEDEDEGVRTAVAKAIDRNLDPILNQGIRNLLRDEDAKAEELVILFLNSESERVFEALLDHLFFKQTAVQYLKTNAHDSIRKKFLMILQRKGEEELVRNINKELEKTTPAKPVIWAIDDSRMILRMYRSMLHALGYDPVIFEFPGQACERIQQECPDLIFTDLNMPKITGIDLTRTIRESYSNKELPIIMVTTQSKNQDHKDAITAGISHIMQKPFTKETLKATIEEYTHR